MSTPVCDENLLRRMIQYLVKVHSIKVLCTGIVVGREKSKVVARVCYMKNRAVDRGFFWATLVNIVYFV